MQKNEHVDVLWPNRCTTMTFEVVNMTTTTPSLLNKRESNPLAVKHQFIAQEKMR